MAPSWTGVQLAHPAPAAVAASPASTARAAAWFSPTAPIREPPNHAARPRSLSERAAYCACAIPPPYPGRRRPRPWAASLADQTGAAWSARSRRVGVSLRRTGEQLGEPAGRHRALGVGCDDGEVRTAELEADLQARTARERQLARRPLGHQREGDRLQPLGHRGEECGPLRAH